MEKQLSCIECNNLKEGKYCKFCDKETANLVEAIMVETTKSHDSIGLKQKRPGFKKFVKKIFYGFKSSGDTNLHKGVDVSMVIDRKNNEYHHIVKNNIDGKVIHEEHLSLEQHK